MAEHVFSIVVPAYNEERFIGSLIERIRNVDLRRFGISKEIIVVDDGSRDATVSIARRFEGVIVHAFDRNQGKGAAIKQGIQLATGDYVVIQDADLEYDPSDYVPMLEALLAGGVDAVYGSRYIARPGTTGITGWLGGKYPGQSWTAYLGGRTLSVVGLICTHQYLTDTVTALKMFKRDTVCSLDLQTTGFETDHEITARLLTRGCLIAEVPIRYSPRSKEEGKKIGLRDWLIAVRTFWRYRNG
jgi:glycosyltransferase involved in cell wall biosynthesis